MSYTRQSGSSLLARNLTDAEEATFQEYARVTDPPDLAQWALYHPVCRRVWVARGITGPCCPAAPAVCDCTR